MFKSTYWNLKSYRNFCIHV